MARTKVHGGRPGPRPARPVRPERGGRLPVALVFPGPESLALSTLGWQVVWRMLASMPWVAAERFFLDPDAAGPPVSEDYGSPLSEFPCILVSLNFEEEPRALLAGLLAAGIALQRADRPGWPLILAGGPLVWLNPAPLTPCVDLFFVGEAEAGVPMKEHSTTDVLEGSDLASQPWLSDVLSRLADHWLAGRSKDSFLGWAAGQDALYIPGLSGDQVRRSSASPRDCLLDPAHSEFVSPRAEFKDMLLLEVNRGCPYGCRFCAAGHLYRPPRQADMARLQNIVAQKAPAKVGLVGTALTDWPDLLPFLRWLRERKIKFGLSSVRADGLTDELLGFLRSCGVKTVTLALEAPSRRLRKAAGKGLKDDDFLAAVERASGHGFSRLKVYLIAGWPGETDADYAEFEDFLERMEAARRAGKGLEVVILSVNPLVPKPWTPLQWAPMAMEAELERRFQELKALARPYKGLRVETEGVFSARLQGYLARAGAEAWPLMEAAARLGGWRRAMKETGTDFGPVLDRERDEAEAFPWEVVNPGVERAKLWREWRRYWKALAEG